LYGSEANDISEQVAKALNEAYGKKEDVKAVATEDKETSKK